MDHIKSYHSLSRETSLGSIIIEGPLTSDELGNYHFHEALTSFRPAPKQFEAALKIADFKEGRLIIARTEDTIIGYVIFVHADPLERWSKIEMENLLVLGAIEVIPVYRGEKVASGLLQVSMMDDYIENYIVISTEYYWHWDLRGTKLSMWDYRKVMEKMMAVGGLKPAATDDPEITAHPANCLMVRIGENVSEDSIELFDQLRFLGRYPLQTKEEK